MSNTSKQYDQALSKCREIFLKKMYDYGTAWRILRITSLTDQIFIKAQRIRTIEEVGSSMVDEGVEPEFIGIINYSIMSLIQLKLGVKADSNINAEDVDALYMKFFTETKDLMMKKNHDYGEAWRDMRISSFTDLILMKLLRVKQIEDHDGETIISEGIDANYQDIINYSIFALIKIEEQRNAK